VHYAQDLAALSDQSEPLWPGDESGRRGVHQCEPDSLVERGVASFLALLDDKAESGSAEADSTSLGVTTDFFLAIGVD